MVLSELALFGIAQAVLLFLGTSVFLFLFNRRITKKNKQLKTKLIDANLLAKKNLTIANLAKQQFTQSTEPTAQDANGFNLTQFFNDALEETKLRYETLGGDEFIVDPSDTPELQAVALRHHFLQGEKAASLENNPDTLWVTIQPFLGKIVSELGTALEPDDNNDQLTLLIAQKEELEKTLEKATQTSDDIRQFWHESEQSRKSTYEALLNATDAGPNKMEIHNLLDTYHNNLMSFSRLLVGGNIEQVDSSLRMEHIGEEKQFEYSDDSEILNQDVQQQPEEQNTESEYPDIRRLKEIYFLQTALIQHFKKVVQELQSGANIDEGIIKYRSKVEDTEKLIKESQTHVITLEKLLTSTTQRLNSFEKRYNDLDKKVSNQIQTIVTKFSDESKELIGTIRNFETDLETRNLTNGDRNTDAADTSISDSNSDDFLATVGISAEQDTFTVNETEIPPTKEEELNNIDEELDCTDGQTTNEIIIVDQESVHNGGDLENNISTTNRLVNNKREPETDFSDFDLEAPIDSDDLTGTMELANSTGEGTDDPEVLLAELIKENEFETNNQKTNSGQQELK